MDDNNDNANIDMMTPVDVTETPVWTFEILISTIIIDESVSYCKDYDKIIKHLFGEGFELARIPQDANSFFNCIAMLCKQTPELLRQAVMDTIALDDVVRLLKLFKGNTSHSYLDSEVIRLFLSTNYLSLSDSEQFEAGQLLLNKYKSIMMRSSTHADLLVVEKFSSFSSNVSFFFSFRSNVMRYMRFQLAGSFHHRMGTTC